MNKTGGGFWKAKATDNDAKVLAIIHDQIEPLCNPYDSASGFFKDNVAHSTEASCLNNIGHIEMQESAVQECQNSGVIIEVLQTPKTDTPKQSKYDMKTNKTPKYGTLVKKLFKQKKIIRPVKTTSAEALKRLYFKKKCQNADLERKKLVMEIMFQKKLYQLKIDKLRK